MPRTSENDGHRHQVTASATSTSSNAGHSHSLPEGESGRTGSEDGHTHSYDRSSDVRNNNEQERSVNNDLVYRSAVIERAAIDEENRTVNLSFSSDEPAEMWTPSRGLHIEVLGHDKGEMDQSQIGSGRAPLLLEHDLDEQIGVVQSVSVNEGRGSAKVLLGRSSKATEIWNDIVDGIRSYVSVGYLILEQQEEGKRDGKQVVRTTKWKPREVSIVSLPVDEAIGVGRSQQKESSLENTTRKEINNMENKETAQEAPAVDVEQIKREAIAAERARNDDINVVGAKLGLSAEKTQEMIRSDKSADQVRAYAIENFEMPTLAANDPQISETRSDASIGLSTKEVKQYKLMNVVRALANPTDVRLQEAAAFEIEASRAAEQAEGRTARGFIMPYEVMITRALDGTTGDGAELIATDVAAGSFIDILRNAMVIGQFSPLFMTGLVGDVSVPGQATSAASNWFDPAAMSDGSETELTTNAIPLAPKYVRAVSAISRNTLHQATPSIEALVRNDLITSLAESIDLAVFYGSGSSSQPTGIQTAVTQVTDRFAAAVPTYAELVAMKKALATANALGGNIGYVTDPAIACDLQVTLRDAGVSGYILENGNTAGYPVVSSNQITSGDVFFGNFNDVVIASWGGLDVTVDTAKYAGSGGIRVIAIQDVDVALRHVASFAWNNDTA